jgi:beta-glucosidase
MMVKFTGGLFLLLLTAITASAGVNGRVIDDKGAPVADAQINYMDIANRLVYAYTKADGSFCIPAPADWDANNPQMYNYNLCNVAVRPSQESTKSSAVFNVLIKGATVYVTVGKTSGDIVADVFDLSGKRVCRVLDQRANEGVYAFNPFVNSGNFLSRQVYTVRISDGRNVRSVRMLNVGTSTAGISSLSSGSQGQALRKVAAVDNIRAGKTGYKAATAALTSYTQSVGDITITAVDIETKINDLVGQMTIDEKVGQMVQCNNTGVIVSELCGSYLKGSSWSAQQSMQNQAKSTRLKIPLTIGTDYVHGGPMVYFPHNIGMGCAGDTLLTELSYRICGMCCREGNNVDFAPCLDVPRNDKYGRVYEGWSETPERTAPMARAAIRGLQGTDLSWPYNIIATAKHFAGAGGTADGVMRGSTNTGTWDVLCKIHLPGFRAAVDAGCASIMTSYNSFVTSSSNAGQTNCTEHKALITDTLKGGWGFKGFVISDWMQAYAPTWNPPINRAVSAVNAGLDVSMSPQDEGGFISIVKGAAGGAIPMSRIDDAVKRHLRVKYWTGLFDNPLANQSTSSYFSAADYRKVARLCVRKSLVLLKNDAATLPLKKTQKICVVGQWADNMGVQCGAWSETGGDSWQGSTTAHGIPGATTILQALQAGITAGGRIDYKADGNGIPSDADVIVCVVGETPYAEDAGYKGDITLDGGQVSLVHTCAAANKPVVTILLTGRPNALGTIPADSKALIAAWLPGTEGTGVSDVLFGDFDFVGKLSISWPLNNGQEPINTGNMGDLSTGGTPLYPYGTGLTYK